MVEATEELFPVAEACLGGLPHKRLPAYQTTVHASYLDRNGNERHHAVYTTITPEDNIPTDLMRAALETGIAALGGELLSARLVRRTFTPLDLTWLLGRWPGEHSPTDNVHSIVRPPSLP